MIVRLYENPQDFSDIAWDTAVKRPLAPAKAKLNMGCVYDTLTAAWDVSVGNKTMCLKDVTVKALFTHAVDLENGEVTLTLTPKKDSYEIYQVPPTHSGVCNFQSLNGRGDATEYEYIVMVDKNYEDTLVVDSKFLDIFFSKERPTDDRDAQYLDLGRFTP